jgi:hypothetical protein
MVWRVLIGASSGEDFLHTGAEAFEVFFEFFEDETALTDGSVPAAKLRVIGIKLSGVVAAFAEEAAGFVELSGDCRKLRGERFFGAKRGLEFAQLFAFDNVEFGNPLVAAGFSLLG